MTNITRETVKLTHTGALQALAGAVTKAETMGVQQNIAIVDDGGNLLAFVRMDGAKLLSIGTCQSKAITAASHRQPTSKLDRTLEVKLALAAVRGSPTSKVDCPSSLTATASVALASAPALGYKISKLRRRASWLSVLRNNTLSIRFRD